MGAQPIRSNICGYPSAPNTSACTASRVSGISKGSVIGQLVGGGAGGAILTAIIGAIKNAMNKQA